MVDAAFDGLCGVGSTFVLGDGARLRCRLRFDHTGDHDWCARRPRVLFGGITVEEVSVRTPVNDKKRG